MRATDRSAWGKYGRIRSDAKGRPVFIIRKQVKGRRYEVSTKKHSLAAALKEWDRFEQDPDRYMAQAHDAVYLDNDRAERFLAYSLHEKRNTASWVAKQRTELAWWMERIGQHDLRRVSAGAHLEPALKGAAGRAHKVAVLKAFYSWMRKREHVITGTEDAARDLASPSERPAQLSRNKTVPIENLKAVLAKLDAPWRDALTVQCGTGWHISETYRFATAGTIEALPPGIVDPDTAGVLFCPLHKSGEPLRTRVTAPVLEAARRLRDHGGFSLSWYFRAVKAACKDANVEAFSAGQIRHSLATAAMNSGATPAAIAAYLHHRSPRTTLKFYATHASAARVPTLL